MGTNNDNPPGKLLSPLGIGKKSGSGRSGGWRGSGRNADESWSTPPHHRVLRDAPPTRSPASPSASISVPNWRNYRPCRWYAVFGRRVSPNKMCVDSPRSCATGDRGARRGRNDGVSRQDGPGRSSSELGETERRKRISAALRDLGTPAARPGALMVRATRDAAMVRGTDVVSCKSAMPDAARLAELIFERAEWEEVPEIRLAGPMRRSGLPDLDMRRFPTFMSAMDNSMSISSRKSTISRR